MIILTLGLHAKSDANLRRGSKTRSISIPSALTHRKCVNSVVDFISEKNNCCGS
jgi:hypothetical protein